MKKSHPDGAPDSASSTNIRTFDFAPERGTIVVDVIEAVASVASTEAMRFEPRLYEAIDPDALAKCVQSGSPSVSVSFTLGEYDVTVRGAGEILVEPI
jgi:hypothetical protein